jgi:molecular chaperone DnaJ
MKDFYEILGVDKNVSDDDLKSAYKKLAKKWHPDRFSTKSESERKEAEEKFKEISEAYDTLSDKQKRQMYDMGGPNGFNPFEDMQGGFDPFADFFSGFGSGPRRPSVMKGENKNVTVEVTLEDVFHEKEKTIDYNVFRDCDQCNGTGSTNPNGIKLCPHCNGTGMLRQQTQRGNMVSIHQTPCPHCHATGKIITDPCPHCNGNGVKLVKETFTFKIPYGVINMPQVQVPQMGHSCQKDANIRTENGDLIITFNIKNTENFTFVQPNNLLHVAKVPLADALLGTTIKVKDIEGKDISIKLDELTESGKVYTFNNKGMKDKFGNRGIFAVRVEHVMPKKLTPEFKKALKNLK